MIFAFQNNKLLYSRRSGDDATVMEEDLRICLVRPLMDIDRRFCFEIISPTKSHILQADSDEIAKVRRTKASISNIGYNVDFVSFMAEMDHVSSTRHFIGSARDHSGG